MDENHLTNLSENIDSPKNLKKKGITQENTLDELHQEIDIPFSEDFPEIEIPLHIFRRSIAREYVLQVMYASELSEQPLDLVSDIMRKNREFNDQSEAFIDLLLCEIPKHTDEVISLIKKYSKNWAVERIAIIDRLAIQIALTEMLYIKDIPPKVSISQAIEIVNKYSTGESKRFVNGILDAVFNDLVRLGKLDAE